MLPAEAAHRASLALAPLGAALVRPAVDDDRLAVRVLGLTFPNPIGLAAGYDKNAIAPDAMARFGFGFVECGTVTPRAQAGNPKPRLFRLEADHAVINRMGFNNDGMEAIAARLRARRRGILGINIGANKDSQDRLGDYRLCFERLGSLADYVSVNVSSPNTLGLRALQDRAELTRLLEMLLASRSMLPRHVPLLLKIAPDLSPEELDDIADVVSRTGIEGVIVSNTTTARPGTLRSERASETGGLSGTPLFATSTNVLREMRKRIGGRVTLIGVGGISSGADAYAKIRAGATLVQLYTALAFDGPGLVGRIKRELLGCLARDGYSQIAEAVGVDTQR